MTKKYTPNIRLVYLDDSKTELNTRLVYMTDSQDIESVLDYVGFSTSERKYINITGALVAISDGDYDSVFLSESSAPYDLMSTYHPLPYYKPETWTQTCLPAYWSEENEDYLFEVK
jgi:hypothetical protein